MIIITGCGRLKRGEPSKAGELYIGAYARNVLRWARSVAPPSRIYILSAKYGLVPHDRVIYPYDMTIDHPDAVKPGRLRQQAHDHAVLDAEVMVVAGKVYVDLVRAVWPHAQAPLLGLRFGYQNQALKRHKGRILA